MADAPKAPNANQKRFCEEYAQNGGNGVRAYFAAYGRLNRRGKQRSYSCAAKAACRLLTRVHIAAEVAACRKEVRRRCRVSLDRLVCLQIDSATADVADFFETKDGEDVPVPPSRLPAHARRCVKAFEVERRVIRGVKGETVLHHTEKIKYVLHDALKARDALAAWLGLADPQTPLEEVLARLSPALRQAVAAELAPLALPGGP